MREDKKLERIELPEIELPGHRGKLRRVLLRQYDQPPVFGLAWPVLNVAAVITVFMFPFPAKHACSAQVATKRNWNVMA